MTTQEHQALRRELNRLVQQWARIWTALPVDCWGAVATQAHERAVDICHQLELD